MIFNNANCQTVETFQRATSSYFGEGIAEGTEFISAEGSGPFAASFDGREVSFKAVELPERERYTLQAKVSTAGVSEPAVVTHAWAQWRNVGFGVGRIQPPKTDIRTGDIVVQPHATG